MVEQYQPDVVRYQRREMKFTPLRIISISGAIGLVATWLGAANTMGTIVDSRSVGERVRSPTVTDFPVGLGTEILEFRQQEQVNLVPAPTRITRNPFSLVRRERVMVNEREFADSPNSSSRATVDDSTSTDYALKLIGFASDRRSDGFIRTAIVEVNGKTVLARQGNTLGQGLIVTGVGEDFVEVTDATSHVFRVELP